MKWMTKQSIILAFTLSLVMVMTPAFSIADQTPQDKAQGTQLDLASLESVFVAGEGDTAELVIKTSSTTTYTSYTMPSPLKLVIDLSQTVPGNVYSPLVLNKGNFTTVTVNRYDTDSGVLTRIEVGLVKDINALITAAHDKPGEIRVTFPSFPSQTRVDAIDNDTPSNQRFVAENPLPVDSTLTDISVRGNMILLAVDGGAPEFKTIHLNKPERYVVDLYDVKSKLRSRMIPINALGVSTARVGIYPEKVRIVFQSASGKFAKPGAVQTAGGVVVSFDGSAGSSFANQTSEANGSQNAATRIEMIDFQVINDISRIMVKTVGSPVIEPPVKSPGFLTLSVKNATLPKRLQRSLETKSFTSPVLRITPFFVTSPAGKETRIRIAMRKTVPYEYRQEGDVFYIDFKDPKPTKPSSDPTPLPAYTGDDKLKSELTKPQNKDRAAAPVTLKKKEYTGRRVTLEFADAEVRKIFQLLSEVSNKNFVLGDDVTGTISIKLVNVPWDQALDVILDTKGLDAREEGNVLIVKAKGKFKSQADEEREMRKALDKSTPLETEVFTLSYANSKELFDKVLTKMLTKDIDASIVMDERTNKIIVYDIPQSIKVMRDLVKELDTPEKQVMIEARIVEAESNFTQSLGVNWGVHYNNPTSSLFGITGLDTGFGGITSPPPASGVGVSPGGDLGITFGALGDVALSVRLSAAATAGLIKIVSSPKIATLNHKSAKITQGQQIPYISATSDKVETQFVEAALSLEVTPHINPDGTLTMEIDAKNDSMGDIVGTGTGTAPAINKKQAKTEMLLKNGETVVIGGIYQDSDTSSDAGVPFLMDIPVLGRLFKSNNRTKIKTELLVFITPRILE